MKLFYGIITEGAVTLEAEEQQHILKVLRLRDGEVIYITDGRGTLAKGRLLIEGKRAGVEVLHIRQNIKPFSPRLHIALAPTKNIDRTEFFLEKATELGVSEITFLLTEKTERRNLNIDKLRKQAVAASKQSLRFHFPVINELTKLSDFLKGRNPERTFVAHCNEKLARKNLEALNSGKDFTFLIGPEGDFSEREILMLAEKGILAVALGNQRLRTETAGIFVAAWNYQHLH